MGGLCYTGHIQESFRGAINYIRCNDIVLLKTTKAPLRLVFSKFWTCHVFLADASAFICFCAAPNASLAGSCLMYAFHVNTSIHPLHGSTAQKWLPCIPGGTCRLWIEQTYTASLIPHLCLITLTYRAALFRTHFVTVLVDSSSSAHRHYVETSSTPLQFRRSAARARMMLQHKCPHIIGECVNHTVTS